MDDLAPKGLVYAEFVRSPYAHAKILRASYDKANDGDILKILTGAELTKICNPMSMIPKPAKARQLTWYCLAVDKVRYVGEPVAVLLANDRYSTEDLKEHVQVEYEPLPPVVDIETALEPDSPLLYEQWGDNILFDSKYSHGNFEEDFSRADKVLSEKFVMDRSSAAPIEPRGCLASFSSSTGEMTLWSSTQCPHVLRSCISKILGFPENRLRVIAPDVGGGFGLKGPVYPEEVAVALLSLQTGRPVKWIEKRSEHFTGSVHGRGQVHKISIAVKNDGTLISVKDDILGDAGAANLVPYSSATPINAGAMLMPGPYHFKSWYARVRCVVTNKTPYGASRGFGRPEGRFAIDRMIDLVSSELGIDPLEIRMRNMIESQEMPYLSVTGECYDSGDFRGTLTRAAEVSRYKEMRREQNEQRKLGRYVGIGISFNVGSASPLTPKSSSHGNQWSNIGTTWRLKQDSVVIRIEPSGHVIVLEGAAPGGQSHETMCSQIVADELGVGLNDIKVVHGDTMACPYSPGTISNQGSTLVASAVVLAARQLKQKVLKLASKITGLGADKLDISDGVIINKEDEHTLLKLQELAEASYFSNPGGDGFALEAKASFGDNIRDNSLHLTYDNSCHIALVEVDKETGAVNVLRYAMVHDCGNVINPMIVEGLALGGFSNGIGQALYEKLPYDKDGQLLVTSFMDYLLPTAVEIPPLVLSSLETPSPFTPLGTKGIGDTETIPVPAAIANAVSDALSQRGIGINRIPIDPDQMFRLLK